MWRRTVNPHAKPTIVLVHGAWADGSSWTEVTKLLQVAGLGVVAVQLDLASLAGDIAVTRAVLAGQNGPTILVGHSYGGAVITGAATDAPQVSGLVYVAAFAPTAGESTVTCVADFPRAPGSAHLIPDYRPGFLRIDAASYPQVFMQDVDPLEARALAATQRAVTQAALDAPVGAAAWWSRPSWYMVAADDRLINPDAERAMAARLGATTTTVWGASHALPLAHPAEVAHVIMAAAQGSAPITRDSG
jgi:pimeloyl-ACP methyl ester carboxylesterase